MIIIFFFFSFFFFYFLLCNQISTHLFCCCWLLKFKYPLENLIYFFFFTFSNPQGLSLFAATFALWVSPLYLIITILEKMIQTSTNNCVSLFQNEHLNTTTTSGDSTTIDTITTSDYLLSFQTWLASGSSIDLETSMSFNQTFARCVGSSSHNLQTTTTSSQNTHTQEQQRGFSDFYICPQPRGQDGTLTSFGKLMSTW